MPYCPHCGRTVSPLTIDERGCGVCRREQHWRIHRLARVAPYAAPVDVLVKGLKYRGVERHGDLLGRWLADALARASWRDEIELLVPVPMHWIRWWNRPCRHALVLARTVAARLRLPVRSAVARVRHTPSQLRVPTNAARLENVKGCFEPAHGARVSGRTVCIIDNVMVSGATVCEVARALRAGGARRVYAAIVARSTMAGEENLRVAPVENMDFDALNSAARASSTADLRTAGRSPSVTQPTSDSTPPKAP
jgi:predicted amidophosphoribosyltransferase